MTNKLTIEYRLLDTLLPSDRNARTHSNKQIRQIAESITGEARHQRRACRNYRTRGAQRERLMEHLVVPLGFIIRVEEQVPMTLDHPRDQRLAGQLDDTSICRHC